MRISSVLLPAALFLLAPASGAQTGPYPQNDTAPITAVVVSAAGEGQRREDRADWTPT